MDYKEQLSAMGLEQPSATVATLSPADEITAIARDACGVINAAAKADIGRLRVVDDGMEIYRALQVSLHEVGMALTRHGVRLADLRYEHDHQRPCEHRSVKVDAALSLLSCATCGAAVNPVWWMSRNAEQLTRSEGWRHHLGMERQKLALEIDELKAERSKHKSAVKRARESASKKAPAATSDSEWADEIRATPPRRRRRGEPPFKPAGWKP